MSSAVAAAAVYFAGCALLVLAVRWWRPALGRRTALAYVALTTAFFAQPLLTGALQVATDLAYEDLPYSDLVAADDRPRNFFQADTLLEQVPFHALVRQSLLAGEVPLWSHVLGTGEPLLGNGQAAPFAPLHALALPLATLRALTVAGAWQILLGLLTTHLLLLRLGAGRWGAALGAVAAGLSTYAVVWIYDTPGMAAAFVPGLLLGILLLRDDEPRAAVGLVACAVGLALSGHPETMAHTGIVAALVAGVALAAPRPGRWRFAARLAAAAAIAAALAAPALLPLVDTIPASVHGQALARSPENFQPPPYETAFLLPVVAPLAHGNPPDGNYTLKWSFNEICSGYASLLALALAVAGAVALRGRPLALLLGGAVALLVALRVTPFFNLMLAVPVVGPGAHGRLREFWVLAVALAAGLAVERVAQSRVSRAVAAVAIAAAAAAAAALPPPGTAAWPRAWWLVTLAGAGAALAALLLPRWRPGFAPLVVVAVTADLFLLGVRYHPAAPARLDLAPPPAVAWLMQRGREAAASPWRVACEDFALPPNLGALYGLWDPRGYDPMRPEGAARMVGWWLGHRRRFYQNIGDNLAHLDQAAHDYLGIRYLLTTHERGLPPPWRLAFDGPGGRIWENPRALPLFFMPDAVRRADDLDDEQQEALAGDDFRATGWVAGDAAAEIPAQRGVVSRVTPRANGFDLALDSPTGGVVVSSVSWAAGWQVEGSGRRETAIEVNGGFLGFHVAPGARTVRLRYRPRAWRLGLLLGAAGLIAAGVALALGRRRGGGEAMAAMAAMAEAGGSAGRQGGGGAGGAGPSAAIVAAATDGRGPGAGSVAGAAGGRGPGAAIVAAAADGRGPGVASEPAAAGGEPAA